ncbi:uncharacterized protein K452DRAFT_92498 [Aplosporella prunicola CBS 121167]|uniref:Uncharacterized protein n=1 Tax=Aplosporella prunicola CBS 121167 TaxID=1176127 RepID=A0A6A6B408_9PEZI|nr:uncharacterized protein K452DRAFT_92498 [Aplosporella prunicola CBS 121167]KAF2138348.1 hypothetical protein K452DRAFT_92498 [Aplosporella prunicola CBS 121167]
MSSWIANIAHSPQLLLFCSPSASQHGTTTPLTNATQSVFVKIPCLFLPVLPWPHPCDCESAPRSNFASLVFKLSITSRWYAYPSSTLFFEIRSMWSSPWSSWMRFWWMACLFIICSILWQRLVLLKRISVIKTRLL